MIYNKEYKSLNEDGNHYSGAFSPRVFVKAGLGNASIAAIALDEAPQTCFKTTKGPEGP